MVQFSTEFPVKKFENRSQFVALVWCWLGGMKASTILKTGRQSELDATNAFIKAGNGEELRVREIRDGDDFSAIGFRHDIPDNEGRLWRTEAVVRRGAAVGQDLLRIRTRCIAIVPDASLEVPKKPYLIKSLLQDDLGGDDGLLSIRKTPLWLTDRQDDRDLARLAVMGGASTYLPVVYISAISTSAWPLSENHIEQLAFELGGVAHVIVEPDRDFSFSLRDASDGQNAYGGAVGIHVPGRGMVARYLLGWNLETPRALAQQVQKVALQWRTHMPAQGWEWDQLQEHALRQQRHTIRNTRDNAAMVELYEDEIKNLEEKVDRLKEELVESQNCIPTNEFESGQGLDALADLLGPELYEGEIVDRLRGAAVLALRRAEAESMDGRTQMMLRRLIEHRPYSPGLQELKQDIKRSTKDLGRIVDEVPALLNRHGYQHKSDKTHIRLEAKDGYYGLASLTVVKTPSDHRAGKNTAKQIRQAMGLNLDNWED